jgi:glycosyltransferase involved in cell wall biosynthesis
MEEVTISYAICTHNEGFYIKNLLERLLKYKTENDEIIVVDDNSDDPLTLSVLDEYKDRIVLYKHSLNGDFAEHKNFLISKCTKGDIFVIDADEMVHENLLLTLKEILQMNPDVDLFYIPRINIVSGIENRPDLVQKWNWNIDEQKRINFPDYQPRIFKNRKDIKYINKVHETITGVNSHSFLPANENDYC